MISRWVDEEMERERKRTRERVGERERERIRERKKVFAQIERESGGIGSEGKPCKQN